MINLLEATQEYWRKLDALEVAYDQGEISLEEVDAQVNLLMAELGRKRREAWRVFLANLNHFFQEAHT